MSAFRNYYSYLVDIGSTVLSWKNEFRDTLVANNWVVLRENDTKVLVRPPVSEAIGLPSRGYGVLLVEFTETGVTFLPKLWYNDAGGSITYRTYHTYTGGYTPTTAYNVTTTFEGDSVLMEHNDPVLTSQNLRTLSMYNGYIAAQTTYPTTWGRMQISLDESQSRHEIVITFPLADYEANWDNSYPVITRSGSSSFAVSGEPFTQPLHYGFSSDYPSVTVDFNSGFIYYMSVFDRSVSLATKTTVGYYGPISAVWLDNGTAIQQTPADKIPVELYVIDCSTHNTTNYRFNATTTHGIGYYVTSQDREILPPLTGRITSTPDGVTAMYPIPLPSGQSSTTDERGELTELARNGTNGITGVSGALAYAAGVTANYSLFLGSTFPIVNVELLRNSLTYQWSNNGIYIETTSSFLEEVYMYTQTATDESLHLARIVDVTADATANASDIATSIAVSDTSLFPASGTLIINNEIIQYTSKTATTFSGLSRAQYGTAAGAITTGDTVYATNWFVKINAGAMLAGTTKPTAQ